ncbi:MAG: hypothetical protein CMO01_28575, partial [Thalassobius sp.]|nr:hypothetical protein [Thalassovita sp.]
MDVQLAVTLAPSCWPRGVPLAWPRSFFQPPARPAAESIAGESPTLSVPPVRVESVLEQPALAVYLREAV